MLRAAALAIAQLGDPPILRVLAKSTLLTLLVFAALGPLLWWALQGVDPCDMIGLDACPLTSGESGAVAVIGVIAGLWFLFPAVAIGVVSIFTDEIVAAVERRHYPAAAAQARTLGPAAGAWMGLKSSARLLLYNLLAMPFYLLLLVTGIGPIILFVLVNGIGLGRDLGEMVAARHLDARARRHWIADSRWGRAGAGIAATALFMVPFLNLLAPVLGAAMATHVFHRRTS